MSNHKQAQEEALAIFPAEELKAWYAGLSIESKLAAAMMLYLPCHSPDRGKTETEIHVALNHDVFAAEGLSEKLQKFRQIYYAVRKEGGA